MSRPYRPPVRRRSAPTPAASLQPAATFPVASQPRATRPPAASASTASTPDAALLPATTASLPLAQLMTHAGAAVAAVLAGESLSQALLRVPPAARGGAQALAFHAMRWLGGARAAQQTLAPRRPPADVEGLLLLALSLLWPGAPRLYAEHTVVDQTVGAARRVAPASAAFVNAVLRRFLREAAALMPGWAAAPEVRWQHPAWWVARLREDWPAQWEALLRAGNTHPPLDLRVNARRGNAAEYADRLARAGLQGEVLGPYTVRLAEPVPVARLPGFAEGDVSVQDAHAQWAAPLLLGQGRDTLPAGARVLDACAAPGGKTAHLLELADLDVLALDIDDTRLARVRETLDRLGLSARLARADAGTPADWWDGRPFDAILLDAPCSASGVVRRHPDIRWLRRESDIPALARQQARLLEALWPLLAAGGRLVYVTCSVFAAEGARQIEAFSQRHADAIAAQAPGQLHPLPDNGLTGGGWRAIGGDGFFYAQLVKPV